MTQNPHNEADRKAQPSSTSAGHASASASLDPSHHRARAEVRRAEGDELGAVAHLIAAHTLGTYAAEAPDASASNLCDVATGYFMKGDHAIAEYWYRLVLTLDPRVAVACQNLAAILASAGHVTEAAMYRERAYRIQRVFVEGVGAQRCVLILCAAHTSGNVPFEALLPGTTCCRIKYAIDYAADEEDQQLPPYDLVFNAIGDADVAAPLGRRLDLDYGGIDFTLLPGGQVLVFEANATMLAHFERETGELTHKNHYVHHIVDAFERLMMRHTST